MSVRQPWKSERWLVVDVETTGLEVPAARVIEVGYCVVEKQKPTAAGAVFCKPAGLTEVPSKAAACNKITMADLADAEEFRAIAGGLAEQMTQAEVVIAYNAPFDRKFIENEFRLAGIARPRAIWLDPLLWVRNFDRGRGKATLSAACERRNIVINDGREAHRSDYDSEQAAALVISLLPFLPDDLWELLDLEERWRREQEAVRAEGGARP